MPDDDNGFAPIISVKTFEAGVIEHISFWLSFERRVDIYSGVAEKIFFPANRHGVIQRQAVKEIKNFVREIRLLDSGIPYAHNNSGISSADKFPILVEKAFQIGFVDVAAQKKYVLLPLVLDEPAQRLDIFIAFAIKIIAMKQDEVIIIHRNFFPQRR